MSIFKFFKRTPKLSQEDRLRAQSELADDLLKAVEPLIEELKTAKERTVYERVLPVNNQLINKLKISFTEGKAFHIIFLQGSDEYGSSKEDEHGGLLLNRKETEFDVGKASWLIRNHITEGLGLDGGDSFLAFMYLARS